MSNETTDTAMTPVLGAAEAKACRAVARALGEAFYWGLSPKGSEYWAEVCANLLQEAERFDAMGDK